MHRHVKLGLSSAEHQTPCNSPNASITRLLHQRHLHHRLITHLIWWWGRRPLADPSLIHVSGRPSSAHMPIGRPNEKGIIPSPYPSSSAPQQPSAIKHIVGCTGGGTPSPLGAHRALAKQHRGARAPRYNASVIPSVQDGVPARTRPPRIQPSERDYNIHPCPSCG